MDRDDRFDEVIRIVERERVLRERVERHALVLSDHSRRLDVVEEETNHTARGKAVFTRVVWIIITAAVGIGSSIAIFIWRHNHGG
jgi:hypothetical protein|tara:strand:+ start:489 stop:743 length:255 start_codon:yes stop_codon:yes gene_type:complete